MTFPIDGIRYQDNEQRYVVPAGNNRVSSSSTRQMFVLTAERQELEVAEVKFGFIPGHDNAAFRVRRRFRMVKGGHPQLVLVHYSRGQSIREWSTLSPTNPYTFIWDTCVLDSHSAFAESTGPLVSP